MGEQRFAENAAAALGCPTSLDQETLSCLQHVDADTMNAKIVDSVSIYDPRYPANFSYWPVVDSYAEDPFLPLDPLEALMTGRFTKVPFISGTVILEGSFVPIVAQQQGSAVLSTISVPPKTSNSLHYGQDSTWLSVALDFYNHTAGESNFAQELPAMDFATDAWFLAADQKSVELMSGHVRNVYNYLFSQSTNHSWLGPLMGLSLEYTPTHGDDEVFLIDSTERATFSEEERLTAQHLASYWTNFAKHGNPSPIGGDKARPLWYPVTPDTKNYMDIKAEPEMMQDLAAERMYFWEKMLWQERQYAVEKRELYKKTTQFLMDHLGDQ